jgi:hypothetical protein|tara:strand:+ start:578 stop:793 length:216 start_codon:yes stop_codon:yes gene_type:complete
MATFLARRYVLESIWEEQWVECKAESLKEARAKFKEGDCIINVTKMGDLHETNLQVEVDDIQELLEESNDV